VRCIADEQRHSKSIGMCKMRMANASPQDRLSLLAGCVLLTRVKNGGLSGLNGGHKGFYVSMLLRKRLIDFYDGAVFFTPSKCVLKGL
jgi:hypothetical protein